MAADLRPGLVLEINVRELLAAMIDYDKAGVLFPRQTKAADKCKRSSSTERMLATAENWQSEWIDGDRQTLERLAKAWEKLADLRERDIKLEL